MGRVERWQRRSVHRPSIAKRHAAVGLGYTQMQGRRRMPFIVTRARGKSAFARAQRPFPQHSSRKGPQSKTTVRLRTWIQPWLPNQAVRSPCVELYRPHETVAAPTCTSTRPCQTSCIITHTRTTPPQPLIRPPAPQCHSPTTDVQSPVAHSSTHPAQVRVTVRLGLLDTVTVSLLALVMVRVVLALSPGPSQRPVTPSPSTHMLQVWSLEAAPPPEEKAWEIAAAVYHVT